MPLNLQTIEKFEPVAGSEWSGTVEYVSMFRTIQGEGPFAGRPALFVRLAGCNLQCPVCDTDYTTGRERVGIHYLVQLITEKLTDGPKINLVVITGGEPFRQEGLKFLCRELCLRNIEVQIETNGTLFVEGMPYYGSLTIVCSPKTPKLDERLVPYIKAYKYVLAAGLEDPADGLPVSVLGNGVRPARPPHGFPKDMVFVQPTDIAPELDMENGALEVYTQMMRQNNAAAVKSCLQHGYRLSLQMHKLVGLA